VKATLWDGFKQIKGELEITDSHISFSLADFRDTNLELCLKMEEIKTIRPYRIYGISDNAIEVTSKTGKKNVFVLEGEKNFKNNK